MYYVYVLFNYTAGKRYIGQTDNLYRRIAEHNGQGSSWQRYTSKFPGRWELVYHEPFEVRSEAMRREKWLKSGVGRKWVDRNFGRVRPPAALDF